MSIIKTLDEYLNLLDNWFDKHAKKTNTKHTEAKKIRSNKKPVHELSRRLSVPKKRTNVVEPVQKRIRR